MTSIKIAINRAVTNFMKAASPCRSKYTVSSIIPVYVTSVYFIKDDVMVGQNRYNRKVCHDTMHKGSSDQRMFMRKKYIVQELVEGMVIWLYR